MIVPGHFKAFTFWFLITMVLTTFFVSHNFWSMLGISMIVIGSFLGDQATHLSQTVHADMPQTTIERLQQKYRYSMTLFGMIIAIIGCVILF